MKSPEEEKFTTVFKALGLSLSKQEFVAAFKGMKEYLDKAIARLEAKIDRRLELIRDGRDGKDGAQGAKGDKGDRGDTVIGPPGPPGPPGRDGSPDDGDAIIRKINEGSALTIKRAAIEGYEADQASISTRLQGIEKQHGSQTPAKAFRIHTKDASSQCDGANKAFSVGGTHFGIISVSSTQFPLIYRPVIDFTETKTGILLTDAVSAPEEGQTLVITFLK